MWPQSKTIASDLITRINLAKEKGRLHDWEIHSFEDEANKLRSADVAAGDMILGILAAYSGDTTQVRKRFKNAMAFGASSRYVAHNYGIALFLCGDYGGAIQILEPICDDDKEAALIVARACQYLGLTARANKIFEILDVPEDERVDETEEERLTRAKFIQSALDDVEKSFTQNEEIWRNLSTR